MLSLLWGLRILGAQGGLLWPEAHIQSSHKCCPSYRDSIFWALKAGYCGPNLIYSRHTNAAPAIGIAHSGRRKRVIAARTSYTIVTQMLPQL